MTGKNKNETLEVVRGSGNVFRDFNDKNASLEQLRAILAARVIKVLDDRKLTVRKAAQITGFAAADFSRLRHVRLERFTIDRLILMLEGLDRRIRVSVKVSRSRRNSHDAVAAA
jgi:predicted XRE-type DNA-binding protein